jgi:hypothetical protein
LFALCSAGTFPCFRAPRTNGMGWFSTSLRIRLPTSATWPDSPRCWTKSLRNRSRMVMPPYTMDVQSWQSYAKFFT